MGSSRLESKAANNSCILEETSCDFDHFDEAVGELHCYVNYKETCGILVFTDATHGEVELLNGLNVIFFTVGVVHTWHIDQLNHSFCAKHLTAVEIDRHGFTLCGVRGSLEWSIILLFWIFAGQKAQECTFTNTCLSKSNKNGFFRPIIILELLGVIMCLSFLFFAFHYKV